MNKFNFYCQKRLENIIESRLKDAMLYALEGGKHFRSNLLFSILKGFYVPEEVGYPFALALEMVHSYSLVHDDLPCMDDDDMRRGRPTTHKQFDEATAVLAGDALLTHAFLVVVSATVDPLTKLSIVKELAKLSGPNGMIYGQILDIKTNTSKDNTEEDLQRIQDYKTGCLFKCALLMGMHIVKDQKNRSFYEKLGILIGRIFQMQDDLFDCSRTTQELGKDANSDIKNEKFTSNQLYDVKNLQKLIHNHFELAYRLLDKQAFDTSYLKEILIKMENR